MRTFNINNYFTEDRKDTPELSLNLPVDLAL